MLSNFILERATLLGEHCVAKKAVLCGAESCTGGLIAAAITSVSGSSAWFDRAAVTYSNAAKIAMLCVQQSTLDSHGAVSEATAAEMARGALDTSDATHAYAVTGVAGPTGGSPQKPVGTVCFAFATREQTRAVTMWFSGGRDEVREQSAAFVINELLRMVKE